MGSLSTAVRAFFTRRIEPSSIVSYVVLGALVAFVVAGGVFLLAFQFSSL